MIIIHFLQVTATFLKNRDRGKEINTFSVFLLQSQPKLSSEVHLSIVGQKTLHSMMQSVQFSISVLRGITQTL